MSLTFAWMTHRNDGGCLVQSVRSVLGLGVDPGACFVYEQIGRELLPEHRDQVAGWGVGIRSGRYTRRDLYADYIGRLRAILETGGEWIYNVDSDTVINSLGPVTEVMASEAVAAAAAWPGVPFSGCSSIFRASAGRVVLADLLEKNSLKLKDRGMASDTALCKMLEAHFGPDAITKLRLGSYLKRYRYAEDPEQLSDLGRYAAIHFGERRDARPLAKGRPVRAVVEDAMREFLDQR